jgi:hypothetical protein
MDHLLEVAAFEGAPFVWAQRNGSGWSCGDLAHAMNAGRIGIGPASADQQEYSGSRGEVLGRRL